MTASDWVIVGTSLFLGIAALLAPYIAELLKREWFAPKLEISYRHAPPYSLRTEWRGANVNEPVFYFRFEAVNRGKSQAKLCEAILEELWIFNVAGEAFKLQNFSPVNLHWAGYDGIVYRNITPGRRGIYCDIGHISSPQYQQQHEKVKPHFIDIQGREGTSMRFLFDEIQYPYCQPSCLTPERYLIRVSLYSENAKPAQQWFEITWSGNWQDSEAEMLREIVIRPTRKPVIR